MTQQLTLDLLALIIEQLVGDRHTLFKITFLCSCTYPLVLPVLYRSNDFLELEEALRFCSAILNHSKSPGRYVHKLYMQVPFWGIPGFPITADPLVLEQVRVALRQMPNLQELSLFGFGPVDLTDCPFKLKYLLMTPPTNEFTAKLMRNQPALVELNFTSLTLTHQCINTDHFLGPEVLPNLRTLTACPKLIGVLAPGRPITHVFIQVCTLHALNKAGILSDIASLDRTSTPVQSLYVDLDGCSELSGWNFIEHLQEMRVRSSLVCLTIKANLLDFATQQATCPSYLTCIAQLLRNFTSLRHFEVEEAIQGVIEEQPAAHEIIDMMFAVLERQASTSTLWRQNCPSLTSVKLFDRTII